MRPFPAVRAGQTRTKRPFPAIRAGQTRTKGLAHLLRRRVLQVQKRQDLWDRSDPRARPVPHFLPQRLLALAMDEDRAHPDPFRACQLVVRAVADEHRLRGLDPELFAREPVDPRVRLAQTDGAREHRAVEQPGERRLVPDLGHVLAADGDQPDAQASLAELLQRLDRPRPRLEHRARRCVPKSDDLVRERILGAQAQHIVPQRPALSLRPPLPPQNRELVRIATQPSGHLVLDRPSSDGVEVDERVPEIEDDGLRHAFRTRTAVPLAQISVQVSPISDVSNRMATIAFAPLDSASSTIRSITCWRLSARAFVIPFSSPPSMDLNPAPICENALRERTVSPNTSPYTSSISCPGSSFVVAISIRPPFVAHPTPGVRRPRSSGRCRLPA